MRPFDPFVNGYHDTADQLREHLRRRADRAFARADREKASLASVTEFNRRCQRLREEALLSLGGLPELPAEVGGSVTGTIDCGPFTIEKLLLETLPGVYASANLYRPTSVERPLPGVLFLCGHAREAKAYPEYQHVCRALVRDGMVVLALDPIGQGERLQYVDPDTGEELVGWGTTEHSHTGFQCHVAGFNVARYLIADAKQALTYLAARPEVDETMLGVTGNSGGGTQSSYLTFFDDRLHCSAPFTYLTSRASYMATGQAHDSEQNLFRAVAMGLDYDDLVAPHAPKPLMIGAVASDFFCIEGTLQCYERLRRVYELHGPAENLTCVVSGGTHLYSDVLRDQVRRFFRRHLHGDETPIVSGLVSYADSLESPLEPLEPLEPTLEKALPPDSLWVTPHGNVALARPEARSVYDLTMEAWAARRARRNQSGGKERRAAQRERLRTLVLGPRPRPPLWVREIRSGVDEATGAAWFHRFTFSEPGIVLPMIEVRARGIGPNAPLTVVALAEGTETLRTDRERFIELLRAHPRILLFDPRGVGATKQRPVNGRRGDGIYSTLYKLNYDAMMLGDSLFAMRAFDALRALEYAHRIAPSVRVTGEGSSGLVLLAAAVLDGDIAGGEFTGLLRSFEEIVTERLFRADLVLEVFNLLDLPDVADLIAALPHVHAREFVDGRGVAVAPDDPAGSPQSLESAGPQATAAGA